jgi:serine/threonine-protein kinase
MDQQIPEKVLKFRIIEKLGQGKNGIVYLARDPDRETPVALKVLGPEITEDDYFRKQGKSALKAVATIEHPNIGRVHEIIEDGTRLLISQEFIDGRTLRQIIDHQPLVPSAFLELATRAAAGLDEAHRREIPHGNLHPGNIMVDRDGTVKLTDFGLPRRLGLGLDTDDEIEFPGDAVRYASPEEIKGHPRELPSDFFSLGLIFFEMLTGQPAFKRDSREETAEAILKAEADFLPLRRAHVPGDIQLLLRQMLAKNINDRCRSCGELAVTVESITAFEQDQAKRTAPPKKARSPRPYLIVSLLAVIVFILWMIETFGR